MRGQHLLWGFFAALAILGVLITGCVDNSPVFNNTSINQSAIASSRPIAEFSGTPASGTAPLTVSFSDLSSNIPTGHAWFFGDETYSASWTLINASAGWSGRSGLSSVVMPDGSIILTGGLSLGYTHMDKRDLPVNDFKNDTWISTDNGASWALMNASSGWSARMDHRSVAMPDGSIVLMGGYSEDFESKNDVWRSIDKGATWVLMNASAWGSRRLYSSSAAMPNGSIVLTGGMGDDSIKNDTWISTDNGASWTVVNSSSGWSARIHHSSVVMPDGSIIIMGGRDTSTSGLNDVWRSADYGTTWTLLNAGAGWNPRYYQTSVTLPDGSIILTGGIGGFYKWSDAWKSMDGGATWTLMNTSAGWGLRSAQTAVAMPDGSIVLMGGCDENGFKNDVWRFQPVGSTALNPSHIYTKPGNYTVTLQTYNTAGYNSTQKVRYITVT